ncbi:MAG: hypothetical protein WB661_03120 [Candidatus Bathyarchaeia archaeon]
MKVALVSDNGKNVSQHFGRARYYVVVTVENGHEVNREVRDKLGPTMRLRPMLNDASKIMQSEFTDSNDWSVEQTPGHTDSGKFG